MAGKAPRDDNKPQGTDPGKDVSGIEQSRLPDVTDVTDLTYEQAREELISIVTRLEAGQAPLEDSMALWRRGEALAAHCSTWLDGAQAEIEQVRNQPPA